MRRPRSGGGGATEQGIYGRTDRVDGTKWTCPGCGDEMHPKFKPSHGRFCEWISWVLACDVEVLLFDLEMG